MKDEGLESGGEELDGRRCRRGEDRVLRALQLLGALVLVTLALPLLIPLVAIVGGIGLGFLGLAFGLVMAALGIALKLLLVTLKVGLAIAGAALAMLPVVLCVLGVIYLFDRAERRREEELL